MRKTLLLVFIHGFKGDNDTFGTFPEHFRALLSHALPSINILVIVYPRYETRGQLTECVGRFREWLENKVIDLEVENNTPSPTIDPAVHVILVGHSMGGIVAAETLLLLANDDPIAAPSTREDDTYSSHAASRAAGAGREQSSNPFIETHSLQPMFPHVQGLLAFDTPFLGLAPQMVAHGLEGGHKMASSAYNTYTEVASLFGLSGAKTGNPPTAAPPAAPRAPAGALPAPTAEVTDAAAIPKWQSWGKMAMFAGAAGAVAAGGAAALYSQREKISAGWSWASSHLLFIGDLAKAEFLRKRVEKVNVVCGERQIGAANLYTNLGRGAREGYGITEQLAGRDRTFCNLPVAVKEARDAQRSSTPNFQWVKTINDKAKDETSAHVSMFFPKDNPGFYALGESAKELVAGWIDKGWYEGSTGADDVDTFQQHNIKIGSIGRDWEGLDGDQDADETEGLHMRDETHDLAADVDEDMLEASVIVDKTPSASVELTGSEAMHPSKASRSVT